MKTVKIQTASFKTLLVIAVCAGLLLGACFVGISAALIRKAVPPAFDKFPPAKEIGSCVPYTAPAPADGDAKTALADAFARFDADMYGAGGGGKSVTVEKARDRRGLCDRRAERAGLFGGNAQAGVKNEPFKTLKNFYREKQKI
jgi:hypothetical protein